ncbi:hypothetical protein [Nocardioides sp.]|uniref:hypothetical protein n=1 Tax=Nocardioides sp. TaxID=35761 RepID=UPI00271E0D00|nr:hypothetical protein [Nocardioides sp.]MDO9457214.1 hypothetical protein [Nocardioides sp.]
MTTSHEPVTASTEDDPRHRRHGIHTGVKVAVGAVLAAAIGFCVVLVAFRGADKGESLTPETAQAGQCVDIAESAGRIDITEADCDRAHDAEIVLTTRVGEAMAGPAELDDAEGVCSDLMSDADVARLTAADPALDWGLLIDQPENVDPFDRLVCYVRSADGHLGEKLLG